MLIFAANSSLVNIFWPGIEMMLGLFITKSGNHPNTLNELNFRSGPA